MDQDHNPRERSFTRQLIPDWRPSAAQVRWAISIAIVLSILLAILALIERQYRGSLFHLVQLLITACIPVVIAVVATRHTQQSAQDDALEAYLDDMSDLIIDHDLRWKPDSEENQDTSIPAEVSMVARARTLALLPRLDGPRKYTVLLFLLESALVTYAVNEKGQKIGSEIVSLAGANLSTLLVRIKPTLGWNLAYIALNGTDLSDAYLHGVAMQKSVLSNTDLSGADLSYADLTGADLKDADLTRANLTGARGVSKKQLTQCLSLARATLPNGHKYEDWLKSPDGQDWLRKLKENLGAHKKETGEYESWLQTTEGQMWLKAIGEDAKNSALS